MTNSPLPDADHFSRYCKAIDVQDGEPLSTAFQLRGNEDHLSVNWLEYFGEVDQQEAVELVRETFLRKSYQLKVNGRFAVLNVGAAKQTIRDHTRLTLRIQNMPVSDDESHSGILGYKPEDLIVSVALAALLVPECGYPAVI